MDTSTKYDLILIQPPLFQTGLNDGMRIEKQYWDTMHKHAGQLLGDLPLEASWGIMSVGTYVKSFRYCPKILDFHLQDYVMRQEKYITIGLEEVKEALVSCTSKFWGISVLTISDEWANIITNEIKKIHPDSYVFWGGYYPTNNDESLLRKNANIDFIVRHEGEYTVKVLLDAYKENTFDLSKIRGVSFIQERVFHRNDAQPYMDVDDIPIMDYTLYTPNYRQLIVPRVYTARGCPNRCDYCTSSNFGHTYRRRNNIKVVDEIELLMHQFGKKFFVIGDLNFLSNQKHAIDFCQEVIRRQLDIKWWCQAHPLSISESVLGIMRDAGVIQIAVGIETSNEQALGEVNKSIQFDATIKCLKTIKSFGIDVQAYIMLGLPGDTLESSLNTIKSTGELLKQGYIDVTHISVMVPYPGSKIHKDSEKYGITLLHNNYSQYLMNCDLYGSGIPPYNTSNLSNLEIYSLWLLALAHMTKIFPNNNVTENYFYGVDKLLKASHHV